MVIQPSSQYEIVEDRPNEKFSLILKKIGVGDAGVYAITAKNEIGETVQQAKLTVHSEYECYTTFKRYTGEKWDHIL